MAEQVIWTYFGSIKPEDCLLVAGQMSSGDTEMKPFYDPFTDPFGVGHPLGAAFAPGTVPDWSNAHPVPYFWGSGEMRDTFGVYLERLSW